MEALHGIIRIVPKPVIAKVRGFAIGGGNVLATLCDLTIAAENAQFGQVGPKVGSVDPGFGTAYLARIVGDKKAREIWYMCRRYSAQEALAMGLVNKVVPDDQLDAEVDNWCREIMEKSPTASRSPSARSMPIRRHRRHCGIGHAGAEAVLRDRRIQEGVRAYKEKRKPDFRRHAK